MSWGRKPAAIIALTVINSHFFLDISILNAFA